MRNRFFVGEQPEKVVLSIVIIDTIPLPEEAHNKIFELKEVSDIMFIISGGLKKDIVARKFGSLYQACCWVEAETGLPEVLMEALEYDKEIFGSHVLTMITGTSWMTDISGDVLQKLAASSISKPILKTQRLTSQEFFSIYKDDREEKEGFKFFFLPSQPINMSDLYTTHKAISKEIIIKPGVTRRMIDFWKSIRDDGFTGEGYVCSFGQPDIRYFLASILKRLKTGDLEIKPDEI